MKEPKKPTRPYKPTKPLKPLETVRCIKYIDTELLFKGCSGASIKNLLEYSSVEEIISSLFSIKEKFPSIDLKNVFVEFNNQSDYDGFNFDVCLRFYEESPNPNLEYEMKNYKAQLRAYDKKLEKYKKDLEKYNTIMLQYEKEFAEWQNISNATRIKQLEKEIAKLKVIKNGKTL